MTDQGYWCHPCLNLHLVGTSCPRKARPVEQVTILEMEEIGEIMINPLLPVAAVDEIHREYLRVRNELRFPPMLSPHEGLAILWEEFEELKAEVFKRHQSSEDMREEAIQVGAMALAFILECT